VDVYVIEAPMQTKLTLRIEEELINRAKSYSQRTGKSVSQLVADYIKMLPWMEKPQEERAPVPTPIVESMRGVLRGVHLDEEEYRRYLEEKYR
jgi:Family of unknown function (DUF6364)